MRIENDEPPEPFRWRKWPSVVGRLPTTTVPLRNKASAVVSPTPPGQGWLAFRLIVANSVCRQSGSYPRSWCPCPADLGVVEVAHEHVAAESCRRSRAPRRPVAVDVTLAGTVVGWRAETCLAPRKVESAPRPQAQSVRPARRPSAPRPPPSSSVGSSGAPSSPTARA